MNRLAPIVVISMSFGTAFLAGFLLSLMFAGCSALTTVQKAGNTLCHLSQELHDNAASAAICDTSKAMDDWGQVATAIASRTDVVQAKEAVAPHPAASIMPCVAPPKPDPESLIFPRIVEPPRPGE